MYPETYGVLNKLGTGLNSSTFFARDTLSSPPGSTIAAVNADSRRAFGRTPSSLGS